MILKNRYVALNNCRTRTWLKIFQEIDIPSKPVNKDTEGTIKSACFNGVSVLSELNIEKMRGLAFSEDKKQCP